MIGMQCPSCHACVRPDAPFCLLCHLDLRPTPEPVPALAASPGRVPQRGRHSRVTGWPCSACETENDLDRASCETCGSPFLGGLQASVAPALRLPIIGDLGRFGRTARVGIAVAMGLLCALLLSVILGVAGALL